MKRRQHTENTKGDEGMPPARVYPQDGISVSGHPGLFRMRSGKSVYGVAKTGAVVRVGDLADFQKKTSAA